MIKEKKTYITAKGHKLIYNHLIANDQLVIFLGGFMSDMQGAKALFFEEYCKEKGFSYIRFDYLGHGESDLKFTDCTIDTWFDNVCEVITNIASDYNKITLIGSSLGGWLACLVAQKFPDKITNLITIACAADFTEELIWHSLSPQERQELQENNLFYIKSCDDYSDDYPITMDLIKSGRKYLLLNSNKNINIPIRMFHGMQDKDVPYKYSIRLAQKFSSDDVEVILIKNADHRLSDRKILKSIARFI